MHGVVLEMLVLISIVVITSKEETIISHLRGMVYVCMYVCDVHVHVHVYKEVNIHEILAT